MGTTTGFSRLSRIKIFGSMLIFALLVSACQRANQSQPRPQTSSPSTTPYVESSGYFPTGFIPNRGQFDPQIQYESKGFGAGLFLTASELIWSPASGAEPGQVLRMQYIAANLGVDIASVGEPTGRISIFKGQDASRWQPGLPAYPGLEYRQLYPGVDLALEWARSGLKSTYFLAAGVGPGSVRWRYSSGFQASVDPLSGDLYITTTGGNRYLVEHAPVAWQETVSGRRAVTARFATLPGGEFSFIVDDYDPALALVIDPAIEFSTYLGGNKYDRAYAVEVDSIGNIFVAGQTESSDFPNTGGFIPGGSADLFLTKFSPDGQSIIYSVVLGGSNIDFAYGLTIGNTGEVFLCGETDSTNFPLQNAVQASNGGSNDAFLVKLAADGNSLLFSTYLGGSYSDASNNLKISSAGNVILTGYTYSTNFPVSLGAFDSALGGTWDGFVAAYDTNTFTKIFATYIGGSASDIATDLAIAPDFSAYIIGWTTSNDFPTLNPYQGASGGGYDAYITRLASNGSSILYSTYFGGSGTDLGISLALDNSYNIYLFLSSQSQNLPLVKSIQSVMAGGGNSGDWYVAKLNSQSNFLNFGTYLGGLDDEYAGEIAVDQYSNIIVTGDVISKCIHPLNRKPRQTDPNDGLLVSLDPQKGSVINYVYLGGSKYESSLSLALDQNGNPVVVGRTASSDFPTQNAFDNSFNAGEEDAFVTKFVSIYVPRAGDQQMYLPMVNKDNNQQGIYGYINYQGCGLASATLELRFYDGQAWSTLASTTSGVDGLFSFRQVPSLQAGQKYYVLYNNPNDSRYLYFWETALLTSYTAGSKIKIGDFDVRDITLSAPGEDSQITLPADFSWSTRIWPPNDSYEFNLYDVDTGNYYYTGPLGYTYHYQLNSLPAGFNLNTWYVWYPSVYGSDGGYGESYGFRWVMFKGGLSSEGAPQIDLRPVEISPGWRVPPIERDTR